MLPQGLSTQFSLVCTFRLRKISKNPWYLLRITDSRSLINMQILLSPRDETLEFSIVNYELQMNTIVFQKVPVSNYQERTIKKFM